MENNNNNTDHLLENAIRNQLIKLVQDDGKTRMTWAEAVIRYRRETKNKDAVNEVSLFKIIHPFLGHLFLDEIKRGHINQIIQSRLSEGVSNTTVNRLLQKIRAVLRKAEREWEVRCDPPYIKMLKEPKVRVRWLTRAEAYRLLAALPPHLKDMASFSLETGLRESNVTLLRWDQVDLNQKIILVEGEDILKSDKPFVVPLSPKAISLLMRQRNKHPDRVFTFKGKPVRRANGKAFRKALERADIENFRWHDLRHTWATWHVQRGTPLEILQELGGWTDYKMVKRYAHYSHEHLHQFVSDKKYREVDKRFG